MNTAPLSLVQSRLAEVVGLLVEGDITGFAGHCASELVLSVPGDGPETQLVRRDDLVAWHRGLLTLAGTGATIELLHCDETDGVVTLRHYLRAGGRTLHYDTLNVTQFAHGKLVSWDSYPSEIRSAG